MLWKCKHYFLFTRQEDFNIFRKLKEEFYNIHDHLWEQDRKLAQYLKD